jgi:hypothetical protein
MSDLSEGADMLTAADWEAYEREKAAWTAAHPNASPAEYDWAMRAIVARLCL